MGQKFGVLQSTRQIELCFWPQGVGHICSCPRCLVGDLQLLRYLLSLQIFVRLP
jgi:hypothetical protein